MNSGGRVVIAGSTHEKVTASLRQFDDGTRLRVRAERRALA
jgi:hypothetical protein